MMKKVVLLSTVCLAIGAADSAFAQAPATRATVSKVIPPPVGTRPMVGKMSPTSPRGTLRSRSKLPPAPSLSSLKRAHRADSSSYAKRLANPYSGDPAGRIDMSGKPVGFYPSSRHVSTPGSQTSPIRTPTPRPKPTVPNP